jgi:DNA polymerase III alpha subunit/intein/homing endonuclease
VRAAELGYSALALTDECSVAGVVRAHQAAKHTALQFIVGSEFKLADGLRLVLLATDRSSYGRLCRLITRGRRAAEKGSYRLTRADLVTADLSGCLALWLPDAQPGASDGEWLGRLFPDRAWLAVELLRNGDDRARLGKLTELGARCRLPLVAAGDVHHHVRERRALQDLVTAIRLNTPLTEAGYALQSSGERHLRTLRELERLYPRSLLDETLEIAAQCRFSLDELRYEYPEELVPPGETPASQLRKLTEEGARARWPQGIAERVRDLIEHELALIAELRYEAYFLTVHDLVRFALSRGILCQGRGSAANSVVCFCLNVTSVDPAHQDVLFERFISKERNEPPDIDIDFEHERREEVIQYVYEKYGRHRAALAATLITYQPRSALRDAGKALGLDALQVERLASAMHWWDGNQVADERIRGAGFDPANPLLARLLERVRELLGFPRHLSQHVGGLVISRGPLEELVPIENAAMPDRTVIQWDKDDLDALGLLKVDVLALGMLTALRRSFTYLRDYRGRELTLATIPAEDPAVYAMIQRADTVGVFQIESRAQMAMLPRLRPGNFYDLVIEVAIVRPGPIQGDMVHPYLRRRNGEEPVDYPSPDVERVLKRTLGIPIFQEQVMQLAVVAAGFSPGEADELRRSMAAWKRRGGLEHFEGRLLSGMRARGYSDEFAARIFKQIKGFGEYGFPECVVGDTKVVDADTGRWLTIDELISGRARIKRTIACDADLRLRKRKVLAVKRSGIKPVWRLRTALGHTIEATAEHPFMTISGWRKLGELKAGDCIAVARSLPVSGRRRWPRHQLLVLADLIAEGNLCHPSTFYFYTTATWHRDEFVRAVERFPNTRAVMERHRSCHSVRVRRIVCDRPIGAVSWARALGIWNCSAREKYLPPVVFELCDSNIALLLARLWEGDGSFSLTRHASYDTSSRRLAMEVQQLLLRLEIVARLYRRVRAYRGRKLEHYVVTVTGSESLRRFWRQIGRRFLDPRKRRFSKELAVRRNGRMSFDLIPIEVRTLIRRERDNRGLTWRQIGTATGLGMREIQSRSNWKKGGFRRFVIDRLAIYLRSRELARLARSDLYWDRITAIKPCGNQPTYDLQIEGNHNFLANNLVVHNSHASSFALLAYASAWIKCYEPAIFTCALLNSLPMGFYAPAQLVRDAREHGVEVRAVDVLASDVDCTLERRPDGEPALRLGLRLVKGLSRSGAGLLVAAREERSFDSLQDLSRRASLDKRDLRALVQAGACARLTGNRHRAAWEAAAIEPPLPVFPEIEMAEGIPMLPVPTEGQSIVADYRSLSLTLGRHPLAVLRERLRERGLLTARELKEQAHGTRVRTAGIVITRQRPASASGVTFVTIEDETGHANLIVWAAVAEAQRRHFLEARLLEVHGELQRQGDVMHVIAARLNDLSPWLGTLETRSRDFR